MITNKDLVKKLLYVLYFAFLFDPGNSIFQLKLPIFVLIVLIGITSHEILITKVDVIFMAAFLVLTGYGTLLGAINGGNLSFSIGILTSTMLLLLVPIFRTYKIDAMQSFCNVCLVLSFVIVFLFLGTFVFPQSIINQLYAFGNSHDVFTIQTRTYAGIKLREVYFHSSPMLLLPTAFFSYSYLVERRKKQLVWAIITIMSFFVSGSRNSMLLAVLIPIILVLFIGKKTEKVCLIIVSIILANPIIKILAAFFSKADLSNSIKIGYLSVYNNIFNANLGALLYGKGIGVKLYIDFMSKYMYLTEISYLNCIFWVGLPLCIIFFFVLVLPLLLGNEVHIKIAYFAFLYMCLLNPFMFNSVGITVISICLVCLVKSDYWYKTVKKYNGY